MPWRTQTRCSKSRKCGDMGIEYNPWGASLVIQMVKNLPAMKETWVRSLGWEDPLEREGQPTPVFLPGEFHGQRSLAGYSPWGHKKLDTTGWLTNTHEAWIIRSEHMPRARVKNTFQAEGVASPKELRWQCPLCVLEKERRQSGRSPENKDKRVLDAIRDRKGFPCGSAGKESTSNAGDLGWILGLGRPPGEEKATHSSILA